MLLADAEAQHPVDVLLGRAEAVDAGHVETTIVSRRVSRLLVALCRSRSTSSLMEEFFSM